MDFEYELNLLIQRALYEGVDNEVIVDAMSSAWVSEEPEDGKTLERWHDPANQFWKVERPSA